MIYTSSCYAHLIGNAGNNLEPSTCVYLDGIASDYSLDGLMVFVDQVFAKEGCKPKIVLVGKKNDTKSSSRTIKWVMTAIAEGAEAFRQSSEELQFFPKARTTVEDTWRPSVYLGISIGSEPRAAFLCVNRLMDEAGIIGQINAMNLIFRSCAAYGFYFPRKFSPLAYFWGIAVNPGGDREGEYAIRESRRLSHWRDNAKIGILNGSTRKLYNVCDGYVRDSYPLMLLSEKHLNRTVGAATLVDAIKQRQLGSLTPDGEQFLWRVPYERLIEAQGMLDGNDISLSGRRLVQA